MSDTSPEHPLESTSPRARMGGYINRYKYQRERLKTLQSFEERVNKSYPIRKGLPKLVQLERDDTNLSSISSKSIETIKLPMLPTAGDSRSAHSTANAPVKPLHLRLYPDHFSRIAHSLPSLPSIPGSPTNAQGLGSPEVSPTDERTPVKSKPAVIPSKNRYEVIAFQKTIHPEKRDVYTTSGGKIRFKKHILYHLDESPRKPTKEDKNEDLGPTVRKSPIKPRRKHKKTTDNEGKGDRSLAHRKWKEDCGCLRCQIIKRQWSEGDDLYKIWGEYPCHHVDPRALQEDDDD